MQPENQNQLSVHSSNQLTILLLHGYLQNGNVIRDSVTNLFGKIFMKQNTIVAPSGPYHVTQVANLDTSRMGSISRENKRGWWPLESKELFCQPHEYKNIQAAIDVVLRELNGREVDVVIGFSQGAVFATVLLGQNLVRAKCVILMSGSDVMDANQKPEPVSIHTPSLHFVGARDTLCTVEHSRLLMETYFVEPLMHTHRWGHVVPRGAAIKKMVLDFIGRHCTDNTNNDNLDDVTEVNDKINDTQEHTL